MNRLKFLGAAVFVAGIIVLSLYSGRDAKAETTTYLGVPLIPYSQEVEQGRYETRRDFFLAEKFFNELFQGNDAIRKKKLVNLPGVKAIHFENLNKQGKWEGINLYQINRIVRYYIIPRAEEGEQTDDSVKKEAK